MAEKARDAFRTISEVANWLDIPAHVLRFWESKFTQIKPVKRAGGRRYYRPDDMRLIGGIKQLLHNDGLTIRGVQKMLKEEGIKHVSSLSPTIDMPSPEEGAARREARRARRQTRQSGKSETAVSAPEPEADIADETKLHVSKAAIENDENVVPIVPSQMRESAVDASSADTVETAPIERDTAAEQPADAHDAGLDQPNFDFDQSENKAATTPEVDDAPEKDSVEVVTTPEPVLQAAPEPEITDDAPAIVEQILEEQAAAPTPAVPVRPDPAVADIAARDDQVQYAALVRQLRSRRLGTETAAASRAKLGSLMERMEALRTRMVDDLSGS